jgi:hypothetical protein
MTASVAGDRATPRVQSEVVPAVVASSKAHWSAATPTFHLDPLPGTGGARRNAASLDGRSFQQSQGIERACRLAPPAAGAARTIVQGRKLLPAAPFERQQVQVTGGDASAASCATRRVDLGKGCSSLNHRCLRLEGLTCCRPGARIIEQRRIGSERPIRVCDADARTPDCSSAGCLRKRQRVHRCDAVP